MELELLKLFFPEKLVAHFDITGSAIKQGKYGDYLEVEFTERNELPEGYSSEEYEAKDFPIRSHAAFLKRRRRRWRHKETGAGKKFRKWIHKVQESGNEYFQSVTDAMINRWDNILNFFNTRSTNAHAESINPQIKLF